MFQYIAIFLSVSLIVPTAQICCPSSSAISPDSRSINILIPIPFNFTFSGFGDFGSGLGGLSNPTYFGYFTRYLGLASANGICPAGVNINGQCWYNSIGITKR